MKTSKPDPGPKTMWPNPQPWRPRTRPFQASDLDWPETYHSYIDARAHLVSVLRTRGAGDVACTAGLLLCLFFILMCPFLC